MPDERTLTSRTSVELFAGGGGLAMAVHSAGFRPLLLNEFNQHACETLAANGAVDRVEERIPDPDEPWQLVRGDVHDLKMGYLEDRVDLLAGGPPCQPFSLGGIAKGDEDRRNMFPEMFRAIREIRPKAVICENVRGLLRPSFRPYFEYILRELEFPFQERDPADSWTKHDESLKEKKASSDVAADERYRVYTYEVNAADYGVPQIRNRVIILAFRGDLDIDERVLAKAVRSTHSEAALLRSMGDGRYWDRHSEVPTYVRDEVMAGLQNEFTIDSGADMKPWRTLRDALYGPDDESKPLPEVPWHWLDRIQHRKMPLEHVGWPDARIYPGHTPNVLDRPAKTVKAGVHGVPGGESVMLTDTRVRGKKQPTEQAYRHRYMTVRETARVMTFPDTWHLRGSRGEKMRQLGNAVPVLLGRVFAEAVAAVLDDLERRS